MSFLSALGKFMWHLGGSRKHPNKPSRGNFVPPVEYNYKESRRAVRSTALWNRIMRPLRPRYKATLHRVFKDRRGVTYIQLSTGQILRNRA